MKKPSGSTSVQLPKDALKRVQLGQSFAEYDLVRSEPSLFVLTPPVQMALKDATKCFFVGRRGTGKTATTYHVVNSKRSARQLHPQVFDLKNVQLDPKQHGDTRQRAFKSVQYAFERALICEGVRVALEQKHVKVGELASALTRERNAIEIPFDERFATFLDEAVSALPVDKDWLKLTRRVTREIPDAARELGEQRPLSVALLLDRIDEAWDGSEQSVLLLAALMHACVVVISKCPWIQPKLFLRENIFERVRAIDNEFARLETSVVSMEWSREQLLELVERRLALPFNTKPPLHGPTWRSFFEDRDDGTRSDAMVFDYCQHRPRDVLTYCSIAIETAIHHNHSRVTQQDLLDARKRFSEGRLKDLGDEYAENYPSINLVLQRFFGLGTSYTIVGIESFVKKLLVDEEVKKFCAKWLFNYTPVENFVHLLYGIGFFGIFDLATGESLYRSVGSKATVAPPLTATSTVVIHPSYAAALALQDVCIGALDETIRLKESGLVDDDLPNSLSLGAFKERLARLQDDLKTLPRGHQGATRFEDIVGELIQLCFFRSLSNVEPQVRTSDERARRDWMASNRATGGFWAKMREIYGASQILWECKNYDDLEASDFHQFASYMTQPVGRLLVCSFRGEIKPIYYTHIRRISAEKGGVAVLLVGERDNLVFMRQAMNGKSKEDHIEEIHDRCVREIS